MRPAHVTLAPGVPDLSALGAPRPEALLGPGAGLWGEPHAEEQARDAGSTSLRVPLPGTAVGGLPLLGRPRGAGTGWVVLRRFRGGPLRRRVAARLTAPRSDSLAAREWNLLCHLRAAGVTTPEPLAVVGDGDPLFAARSALVLRELARFRPATEWFRHVTDPGERARAAAALGRTLHRAWAAGVVLPHLACADLALSVPEHDHDGDHGAGHDHGDGDACHGPPVGDGVLVHRRGLEAAITAVHGARLRARPRPRELVAALGRLGHEARDGLSARERLQVAHAALRTLPRAERRAALRRLARS